MRLINFFKQRYVELSQVVENKIVENKNLLEESTDQLIEIISKKVC